MIITTIKQVCCSYYDDCLDVVVWLNYCSEENVWHLCNYIRIHHPEILSSTYAVFISNQRRQVIAKVFFGCA